MKYRTGTAQGRSKTCGTTIVWCSISLTCPLCPQLDSSLHILFGWQHANKKYDHWDTQLSMQHDIQSRQQNRRFKILLHLHGYSRQQRTAGQANLQIIDTAETRITPKWLRAIGKSPLLRQKWVYLQPSGCCTGCSHLRENKKATD